MSICFIILESFQVFHSYEAIELVKTVLSFVSSGLLSNIFLCAVLEFVCAQAPYNMRRLFTAYMLLNYLTSTLAGYYGSVTISQQNTKVLIVFGIKAAINLLGFILYCIMARWYKRRVRDEDYNAHRVVEEVYDRYLNPSITN